MRARKTHILNGCLEVRHLVICPLILIYYLKIIGYMFSNELPMSILLYIKFITNRHKVFHG